MKDKYDEDYRNKDYYTQFDLELENELKRLYKLMILKNEEVTPDEIFMLGRIKNIESIERDIKTKDLNSIRA